MHKRGKKGVSPLIATILLVGFTIAMAAVVTTFIIRQTKENFNPEKLIDDSSLCDQMVLGVAAPDADKLKIQPGSGSTARLQGVQIQNKGAYAVRGLVVKVDGISSDMKYIFDQRIPGHYDLTKTNLAPYIPADCTADNLKCYIAPAGFYTFGGTDPNAGIPIPKAPNSPPIASSKITVYPIVWDFEKNQPVKCVKSVFEFDYCEVCRSYEKTSECSTHC